MQEALSMTTKSTNSKTNPLIKKQFNKNKIDLDEQSKKEMIRELKIVKGLLPDDDYEVTDLDDYFSHLGI